MSTHTCPAPGCDRQVDDERLACPQHWYALPKPLRNALWAAYNDHGRGSPAHTAAVDVCLRALERLGGSTAPSEVPDDGRELQRRDGARAAELRRCAAEIEAAPWMTAQQVAQALRDRATWWEQQAEGHA